MTVGSEHRLCRLQHRASALPSVYTVGLSRMRLSSANTWKVSVWNESKNKSNPTCVHDMLVCLHTGRSLGQMMLSRSVRISSVSVSVLILLLMHAGMSANMEERAFLLVRRREVACGGNDNDSEGRAQLLSSSVPVNLS